MKTRNSMVTAVLTVVVGLLAACGGAGEAPAAETSAPAAEPAPATPTRTAEAADPQKTSAGKLQFNNACRTCHSLGKGDNRLGPSLHGIIGRKAATAPGYAAYSQAMKNSEIVWDDATLDRFLANPEAVVPNNNMKPFAGAPDPAVRREIIEYLKTAGEE